MVTSESSEITRLLKAVNSGEPEAWERLLAVIYGELRRLAGRQLRRERHGHTLPRTALVNEAYIRLVGTSGAHWESRAHFFAVAADAMRRILVDYARRRKAEKRGGKAGRMSLDEQRDIDIAASADADGALEVDLEALDAALTRLEANERHRDKCTIVKLRYFVGLSVEETAEALNKSPATVKRDWAFARAWLYREMTKDQQQ